MMQHHASGKVKLNEAKFMKRESSYEKETNFMLMHLIMINNFFFLLLQKIDSGSASLNLTNRFHRNRSTLKFRTKPNLCK